MCYNSSCKEALLLKTEEREEEDLSKGEVGGGGYNMEDG